MSDLIFKLVGDKFVISEGYGSIKNKSIKEDDKDDRDTMVNDIANAGGLTRQQSLSASQPPQTAQPEEDNRDGDGTGIETGRRDQAGDHTVNPDDPANNDQQNSKPNENTIVGSIKAAGVKDVNSAVAKINQWLTANQLKIDQEKMGTQSSSEVQPSGSAPSNTTANPQQEEPEGLVGLSENSKKLFIRHASLVGWRAR